MLENLREPARTALFLWPSSSKAPPDPYPESKLQIEGACFDIPSKPSGDTIVFLFACNRRIAVRAWAMDLKLNRIQTYALWRR
jgi:hypothetical protein